MASAECEPITGVWGHRRTGTPLFKMQVKNLLSSEATYGDIITLKPFSAMDRPWTPPGRSSHLVSQGQLDPGGLSGSDEPPPVYSVIHWKRLLY